MVHIGRHKKVIVEQPEAKVKPKVFYQVEPLSYSRYTFGTSGVWFVAKGFVPEFIRFMDTAGFTAEVTKSRHGVDER